MSIRVDYQKDFWERMQRNLKIETEALLNETTSIIQGNIRSGLTDKRIVDTGNLRLSYVRDVKIQENKGIGVVGSNSQYALPMELGITKRFYPSKDMILQLQKWSKRKLGLSDDESKKAGRAIAWKIARRGLDPKRFPSNVVRDAFTKSSALIPTLIERHIRRAMAMAERFA